MRVYTHIQIVEPVETACVCTTLRMTTRVINQVYDAAIGGAGLRATGYAILARLDADGPLSITDLARRLALERSTCSRELQPLVRAGLVDLEPGGDRRRRVAGLSPAGRALLAEARPRWRRAQEQVIERFGNAETETLLTALRRLRATAEDVTGTE
jgi:DNA-binding MarR family transcriptional regulator